MSLAPPLSDQQRLSKLSEHFAQWRASKSKRAEPIPNTLWDQAIELAKVLSISHVSKTLRLSSQDLKKRMGLMPAPKTKPSSTAAISFVDITPPNTISTSTSSTTTEIELYRPDGARLRIHYTQPPSLDTLVRSFLATS